MLYFAGRIHRVREVHDSNGGATMDYMELERERGITITSATTQVTWNDKSINIIDTPGLINFIEDTKSSLSVADGAVVVLDATSGIKAETAKIWKFADDYEVPRVIFVNKMDRENANFQTALETIEKAYGISAIPLNIPIGAESSFEGAVDLVKMKAVTYQNGNPAEGDIPEALKSEAEEYRKKLVENVAESDDALLEKYLEGTDPTDEEIKKAVRDSRLPMCIGTILVELGYIKSHDLQRALGVQADEKNSRKLGEILLEHRLIEEQVLLEVLSLQMGFPQIEPEFAEIDPKLFSRAPAKWYEKHDVIPIQKQADGVLIAFADPLDAQDLEAAHGLGPGVVRHVQNCLFHYHVSCLVKIRTNLVQQSEYAFRFNF